MEIRSLGRYELRGELGRGTMGVVYRGYDPVLDREIALKTVELPPSLPPERRQKFLERFFLEAKIAGKLIHPNIVVTHDAATDDATEVPFIAMELVGGESLHQVLQRGRVPWQDALALIEPLARALDYAHQAGVVHRDIKPANVLLSGSGVPKIADFGIAKLPNTELTQTGIVIGTPYFMSPEHLEGGAVDGRSDLFSLGALLYNLLTGDPPFRGDDLASITQQVLCKSPTPPSELVAGIPESVDGVLARAMTKTPDERYRSGAELADELARVRSGEEPMRPLSFGEKTVESKPATIQPAPAPTASSTGAGSVVSFLLLAALAAGIVHRWEDVSRFFEPIREEREEGGRRLEARTEAAAMLAEAADRLERGEFEAAAKRVEAALTLSRDAMDGDGEARALLLRGRIEAERGNWSKARADFDASASVFEIYDSPEGKAAALVALADLERDLGRFDVAASLYDASGPSDRATFGRAIMALMQGELASAERGFEACGAWDYAGAVALARGDVDAAHAKWEKSSASPELERFRGYAAHGDAPEGKSILRTILQTEPATPRSQERQNRLSQPPAPAPSDESSGL